MKLLLDEQMPRQIARYFPAEHEVHTVQQQGWSGIKNGELLTLAAQHGYDALISADKNMEYQQNARVGVSVVVLHVPRLRIETLIPLIPKTLERLTSLETPSFVRIGV